jgi:hypothetical protein
LVNQDADVSWRDLLDWGDETPPDSDTAIDSPETGAPADGVVEQANNAGQTPNDDAESATPDGIRQARAASGLRQMADGLIAKAARGHWWERRPARRGVVGACLAVVLGVGVVIGITQTRSASRPNLGGDTADQVLRAAVGAVRHVGSFKLVASGLAASSNLSLSANLEQNGALISEVVGDLQIAVAVHGDTVFVRAGRGFWSEFLGVDASKASVLDRWIDVPASSPDVGTISKMLSFDSAVGNLLELRRPVLVSNVGSSLGAPILLRGTLPNTTFNAGAGGGATALLEVSSLAPFFPIQLVVQTLRGTATYHFNDWGRTWALPSASSAVSLATVEEQLRVSDPTSPLLPQAPIPTGRVPRNSVPRVTAHPNHAGVSVDVPEATSVARRLWRGLATARHYRDPYALGRVESGPALLVDRAICLAGCPPPPLLAMTGLTIVVPHQTKWPADFLATAEYGLNCPDHACDDTFVAVQPSRGAPWKINLIVSYSGAAPAPEVNQSASGYVTQPPLAHSPTAYLQQYADYLDSVVGTAEPPSSTWLQPGPFTTGFGSLYQSPLVDRASGYTDRVQYFPGTSPTFTFFASGQPIMCGSVDYYDTETALPGRVLVQPPDRGNFGPTLAPGIYRQVVTQGIHMNCYTYLLSAPDHVWVLGDWRGRISASGTGTGSPRVTSATIATTSSVAPQ